MLNKTTLAQAIQKAFDEESDKNVNPAEARRRTAQKIADAIDTYIKQGTVNVTVATTGTAAAQSGKGTGTIS
jgi:hypothetical protein